MFCVHLAKLKTKEKHLLIYISFFVIQYWYEVIKNTACDYIQLLAYYSCTDKVTVTQAQTSSSVTWQIYEKEKANQFIPAF